MKYIRQPDNAFAAINETSEHFQMLAALPKGKNPFLTEENKEVQDYLAGQKELQEATTKQAELRSAGFAQAVKALGISPEQAKAMGWA